MSDKINRLEELVADARKKYLVLIAATPPSLRSYSDREAILQAEDRLDRARDWLALAKREAANETART